MMSISELLERPSRLGRHESDEVDAQVRLQQVRLLYSQLPTSTGGTMVGALLLAAMQANQPTIALVGAISHITTASSSAQPSASIETFALRCRLRRNLLTAF